jgi:stage V sporulation protein K
LQTKLNEKNDDFSNGRLVRNLFDDITLNQSKRLSKLKGHIAKESLMIITRDDVPQDDGLVSIEQ